MSLARMVRSVDRAEELAQDALVAALSEWPKTGVPVNPGAWQNWRQDVTFPQAGYYEVWSRATDSDGASQPFAIAWNPKGYLNNSMHRIAVRVA